MELAAARLVGPLGPDSDRPPGVPGAEIAPSPEVTAGLPEATTQEGRTPERRRRRSRRPGGAGSGSGRHWAAGGAVLPRPGRYPATVVRLRGRRWPRRCVLSCSLRCRATGIRVAPSPRSCTGSPAHRVADARRSAARHRRDPLSDLPEELDPHDGPEQRALTGGPVRADEPRARHAARPAAGDRRAAGRGGALRPGDRGRGRVHPRCRPVAQHRALAKLRTTLSATGQAGGEFGG